MSIVERLYRIARNRLNDWRHPHQYDGSFEIPFQDFQSNSGNRQQDTSQREQHTQQPQQDPKLATYYANLELPYGADLVKVRAAWKRLMRQYHPDRHSQDPTKRKVAEQLTQGLNEAFHALEKHLQR